MHLKGVHRQEALSNRWLEINVHMNNSRGHHPAFRIPATAAIGERHSEIYSMAFKETGSSHIPRSVGEGHGSSGQELPCCEWEGLPSREAAHTSVQSDEANRDLDGVTYHAARTELILAYEHLANTLPGGKGSGFCFCERVWGGARLCDTLSVA